MSISSEFICDLEETNFGDNIKVSEDDIDRAINTFSNFTWRRKGKIGSQIHRKSKIA